MTTLGAAVENSARACATQAAGLYESAVMKRGGLDAALQQIEERESGGQPTPPTGGSGSGTRPQAGGTASSSSRRRKSRSSTSAAHEPDASALEAGSQASSGSTGTATAAAAPPGISSSAPPSGAQAATLTPMRVVRAKLLVERAGRAALDGDGSQACCEQVLRLLCQGQVEIAEVLGVHPSITLYGLAGASLAKPELWQTLHTLAKGATLRGQVQPLSWPSCMRLPAPLPTSLLTLRSLPLPPPRPFLSLQLD